MRLRSMWKKRPAGKGSARTAPASWRSFRPRLERLEDRLAPATTVNWTGAALNFDWDTAGNWDSGEVPGVTDHDVNVVIDYGTNNFTVVHSTGSVSIKS